MSSGSSKATTNRKNPQKGSKNTDSVTKTLNNNTTKPEGKLKTTTTEHASINTANDRIHGSKSSPKDEESGIELSGEVDADEILKSKGFDDPTLSSYCKETPELQVVFIKLYEHVQSIKDKIEAENMIAVLLPNLKGIKSAYASKKSFRIQKGNFLADIGFADVCKDILDGLLPMYPNLLSLVKFGSDDHDSTENTVSISANRVFFV